MTSEQILQRILERTVEGFLACADAHALAQELGLSPRALGKIVNARTDVRFDRCQLGLFGYGPKAEGKSKIVLKAQNLPEEIVQAIQERTKDGRISCLALWEIAERFRYPRLGIANIAEALELKVTPCQLGCF